MVLEGVVWCCMVSLGGPLCYDLNMGLSPYCAPYLDTLVPKNLCVKTFEYKKFGQEIWDCLGDEKCELILLKKIVAYLI